MTGVLKTVLEFEKKNRSAILMGAGIAGMWTAGYKFYKAAPRANEILARHKDRVVDIEDKHEKKEETRKTIKELIPVLAPPIILGIISSAMLIGSYRNSKRNILALGTAYSMTESAFKAYKEKAKDIVGAAKVQEIREAVSKDKVKAEKAPSTNDKIIVPGDGTVLCKDLYSGRYFYSSVDRIRRVIGDLEFKFRDNEWWSINDLYFRLGLDQLPNGDDFGWSYEEAYRNNGNLPITITACLTEDNRPCVALDYDVELSQDARNRYM